MDTEPQQHDADHCGHDQATSTWLASEAFTDFTTVTFGTAVKRAIDEQISKGIIQP